MCIWVIFLAVTALDFVSFVHLFWNLHRRKYAGQLTDGTFPSTNKRAAIFSGARERSSNIALAPVVIGREEGVGERERERERERCHNKTEGIQIKWKTLRCNK